MTGLLILRYLDLHAYALYTIAGVLIAVGVALANTGLYPATSYFATRVGADQEGLEGTVGAADVIQWWLVVAAAIVLVGLGLSYKHQFSVLLRDHRGHRYQHMPHDPGLPAWIWRGPC